MPSFAGARELGGLLGAARNLLGGAALFVGPELFQQGQSGSLLDRGVQNLPGIVPDPRTDVGRNLGNKLGNELQYIRNQLSRGQIPYAQNMSRQTPLQRAKVGQPMVLNGRLGYKAADGSWQPRGDMESKNIPQYVKGRGYLYDEPAAPPPAPILPPPPESLLPPEERAYQAELARTQQMMASNPYMPQTQLYAQAQSVMQTPEDMAATRDLGLAINRAMYGNQLTPKTPNPLMAGLTPPPGAQPNIPMDQEGRIGQIDTASEGVQEFMRKYLEGKKKREEED
jgi:hypothetical protein